MAETSITTPATQQLDNLSIPYRLFLHTNPIASLEQAAQERGQRPEQIIRSILFRASQGEFIMVLVPGTKQVSWPILRRFLGQSRITMASPDEVLTVTGYPIGAVSPLGLVKSLRLLADTAIFEPDEISIGSGKRGLAIILQSKHLRAALQNIEIDRFA